MEKDPRPEKVAVVAEVREKFTAAEAVVFAEYRGLTVRDLQDLRTALRGAGGEFKVYKNTLVRRAIAEMDLDLDSTLTGPTALTFVGDQPDGTPGDAVLVAKAIKAFAKANPNLVVKGGRLGEQMLDEAGVIALADVAPREELLARLAGGMAAPMTNFARLLQAVPQKMAYALQALIEQGGAPGAPADAPAPAAEASVDTDEPASDPEPAAEASAEAEAPAAEAPAEADAPDTDPDTDDAAEPAADAAQDAEENQE